MISILTPVKMEKIRALFPKSKISDVLTVLHDLNVIQIEPITLNYQDLKTLDASQIYNMLNERYRKIKGLESLMIPVEVNEKFDFSSFNDLLKRSEELEFSEELINISQKDSDLRSKLKSLRDSIEILEKMSFYGDDISLLWGKNIYSVLIKNDQIVLNEIRKLDGLIIPGTDYSIAVINVAEASKFGEILRKYKVEALEVKRFSGTVNENLEKIHNEINEIEKQREDLSSKIKDISQKYYPLVAGLREELEIELKKFEVASKLMGTMSIAIIEGWIPKINERVVKEAVERVTANSSLVFKVDTDEIPPTLLNNPKKIGFFEFFIKFYSYPQSIELDPTLIFAIVFPIFFGLMIGDVGYGLIILLLSLWIIHRVDHPPRVSHIPKAISRFVLSMMSLRSLKILAKAMIPGSIIAILLGILFDNYFGFQLNYPHFNVLSNFGLDKLLLLSGYTGVVMVDLGLIFGFIVNYRIGHKREALGKIGWLLVAMGIVILGLMVLKQEFSLHSILGIISIFMLLGGLGLVVYTEKFQALLEVTTIISHILSYTRLVGILLSSVILALVFDEIFTGTIGHGIMIVLGIIILLIGQLLNLIIAVFEPGIQGARLIYVEFFSKFYKGNGRVFKPFGGQRMYTLPSINRDEITRK